MKEGITGKEVEITGIDGDFKSSLTAYHDFKEKLTNLSLNQAEKECIILNVTLFGDDKAILKQRLKKLFPELTEKQRDSISKLPYRGWGRLSKVFFGRDGSTGTGNGRGMVYYSGFVGDE